MHKIERQVGRGVAGLYTLLNRTRGVTHQRRSHLCERYKTQQGNQDDLSHDAAFPPKNNGAKKQPETTFV